MQPIPLSTDFLDSYLLPDRPLMEDLVQMHKKVLVFQEIDSTNNEAKRMLEAGTVEDGTYLVANHQTAGRGRQGHSFYSPADTGLYVSLIRTDSEVLDPAHLSLMTLGAAVATAEAIEEVTGVRPSIKWVNDLYVGDRKVTGILTECLGWFKGAPTSVVIGVGINCSTVSFPDDIRSTAGSLSGETPELEEVDRNKLAAVLYKKLLYWTEHLTDPTLLQKYRARNYLQGKEIAFTHNRQNFRGIVHDIDDGGRLLVQLTSALIPESKDQLIALDSGEVHITKW